MKNKAILKICFLMALLGVITPHSWGATEFYQNLTITTDSVVEIEALSSNNVGSIDPKSGILTPMNAKFGLKTNSDDSDYDFVLQASVTTEEGQMTNAYFNSGAGNYIILANSDDKPSAEAVSNIKNSPVGKMNSNAIAYPVNTYNLGGSDVGLKTSSSFGGNYYQIIKGEKQSIEINQTINGVPYSNTYSLANDSPGNYEAVITFSAYRKP